MQYKPERINSEMLKSIAQIIRTQVKDPRVTEMVTVTGVNVAKDLKTAKVYVSIFGDKDRVQTTFDALVRCAGFIRHALATEMRDLRTVPELRFLPDTSLEYSQTINTILEGIKQHDDR